MKNLLCFIALGLLFYGCSESGIEHVNEEVEFWAVVDSVVEHEEVLDTSEIEISREIQLNDFVPYSMRSRELLSSTSLSAETVSSSSRPADADSLNLDVSSDSEFYNPDEYAGLTLSSASQVSSSVSEEDFYGEVKGTCVADQEYAYVGEFVRWEFVFDSLSAKGRSFEWYNPDATIGAARIYQTLNYVQMKFSKAYAKTAPTVIVNEEYVFSCEFVEIRANPSIDGACTSDRDSVDVSEYVTWSYTAEDGSLSENLHYLWVSENAHNSVNGDDFMDSSLAQVKFKYDVDFEGTLVAPLLSVSADNVASKIFQCPEVYVRETSSSSVVLSSSAAAIAGTCSPDATTYYVGDDVTWTYTPDVGSLTDVFSLEWSSVDAISGGFGQEGESATMAFADVGVYYPSLTINGSVDIACESVRIENRPVSSSSQSSDSSEKGSSGLEPVCLFYNYDDDLCELWSD